MAKIASAQKKESQVSSGKNSQSASQSIDIQEIQKLAYQFYVDRGYEDGFDQEDWARAEAIIRKKKAN